jgi:hypothetical protein
MFINISITIVSINFSILGLIGGIGGAFVPLVSFASVVLTGFPIEISAFIGIFTGLISGIQIYIIVEVIASHIPTVNV